MLRRVLSVSNHVLDQIILQPTTFASFNEKATQIAACEIGYNLVLLDNKKRSCGKNTKFEAKIQHFS
jgi:hypothetical protein